MTAKNEVFISYRRDGGATVARLLYEVLRAKGLRCFMDAETLGEGNFDQSISKHLEDAENFIFIVSPGVFDRCANEGDWVRREIESALQHEKKIIPVFVSGVTGFPHNLPASLQPLASKNAIKLSHEHFDAELEKMLSWLTTRKTRLIETFIQLHDPDKIDVELIIDTYKNLAGDVAYEEVRNFLAHQIRSFFANSHNVETRIDTLLADYQPRFLQKLCESLGIDATGSSTKLRRTLKDWLQHKDPPAYDENAENGLVDLAIAFGKLYRSHANRETVKSWADEFKVDVFSSRSSTDIFLDIFAQVDVEDFFDSVELDEAAVKGLCDRLGIDSKGRKGELIESIKEYIDNPADFECEE
ncbi:MAG TPA: toll/interleukin-1 receptor domain-containing protein [Noviherbaspirillum sp.]|nr:toll/interleukin-1 receptor domain-containing protein [Noviherbaspirillum sp.]